MREIAQRYPGVFDVRLYQAGRDMEYVAKYGPVMRGTLIIDERIMIERLSRSVIEQALCDAAGGAA